MTNLEGQRIYGQQLNNINTINFGRYCILSKQNVPNEHNENDTDEKRDNNKT